MKNRRSVLAVGAILLAVVLLIAFAVPFARTGVFYIALGFEIAAFLVALFAAHVAFEKGEDTREPGERLAASYVNFLFVNGGLVLPVFGNGNEASDRRAAELLAKLCPERTVVPVYAHDILLGGGNIHCITQQIPKGVPTV